jgi:excinuclease ABC subunit A
LIDVPASLTGQAILAEADLKPLSPGADVQSGRQPVIAIRSARAHNLQDVDVDIPKRMLTVVTGLSGSGKSSLVSDILESEARRRYRETLSMYERQGTHEGAQAEVGSISGLGVALTITPERLVYSRRATVGSATEIASFLAVLLAASQSRLCLECGAPMQRTSAGWNCPACHTTAALARPQHFTSHTYSSACLKCNGVGSLQIPQPKKLIIHPEKALLDGAMYSPGFFPDGYLGKPYNHGYYMVLAMAEHYGFDPFHTPWEAMSAQAQDAFLFGARGPFTVSVQSRTGRSYTHQSEFPGFYGFIRDWDIGGTYTDTVPCPECARGTLAPRIPGCTPGWL